MISAVTPNELFPKFLTQDRTGRAMCAALCAGLNAVLEIIQSGVDEILDPEKMSERRLDEVAWEDNILYDYNADITVKRYLVANAMEMYRHYGTERAVVQALLVAMNSVTIAPDSETYAMAYLREQSSNLYAVKTDTEVEPGTPEYEWLVKTAKMVGNVRSTMLGVAGINDVETVDIPVYIEGAVLPNNYRMID